MDPIRLEAGEYELYRAEIRSKQTLVITNQRIIIFGRDWKEYRLEEITSVDTRSSLGFLFAAQVLIYLPFPHPILHNMISTPVEINCLNTDQAKEIARRIRPYTRPR